MALSTGSGHSSSARTNLAVEDAREATARDTSPPQSQSSYANTGSPPPTNGGEQLVFCTPQGRGLDYRDAGEAFRTAVKQSGITATGRLSLHSLRHAFASLLIAKGLNVVFVSRQLGHANPTVTLGTYAHLFERADHAHTASQSARGELPGDVG